MKQIIIGLIALAVMTGGIFLLSGKSEKASKKSETKVEAKILPCSKDGFQADILIGLFLLLAVSLFLLIAKPSILTALSRANGRLFVYHSFSYKIKVNRWLALFYLA